MKSPVMLCATAESEVAILYPCVATPKLDGIRAYTPGFSRNAKPIQNEHIRSLLASLPPNLDGELISGAFNETSSAVMKRSGKPDFKYVVFDIISDVVYSERMGILHTLALPSWCEIVEATLCEGSDHLLRCEEQYLNHGYEGVVTRAPNAYYKFGRSTMREQGSVKLKRFQDSEARVIGFKEQQQNCNPIVRDELDRVRRPGGKLLSVGKDTLGGLICIDIHTGVEVNVGSGFDDATRQFIWNNQPLYLGCFIKYRYQACGSLNRPRFPTLISFLEEQS